LSERLPLPSGTPLELHRQFRFQWEPAQQCFVLLYPEGMVKLPGSAGEIMKRLDGTRSADEIVKDLETAFPGVDLRADVVEFLEVAHGKGWIRAKEDR
jgi:pyrroloquinoline quinone biosynthesis protein D